MMRKEFNIEQATSVASDSNATNRRSGGPATRQVGAASLIRDSPAKLDGSPTWAVEECRRLVDDTLKTVESLEKFTTDNGSNYWSDRKAELKELKDSNTITNRSTSIAICEGVSAPAMGVGRSSLLNAVLDRGDLLPTGSKGTGCTSVPSKVSHHQRDTFWAEIKLVSLSKWEEWLEKFIERVRLLAKGGSLQEEDLRRDGDTWNIWLKMKAVYSFIWPFSQLPNKTVQDLLNLDPTITYKSLEKPPVFEATTAQELTNVISQYITGSYWQGGGALWPFVREIHYKCNSPALSSGAVLVNLPRIADMDLASGGVIDTYLSAADKIWIVVPMPRAGDSTSLKNLDSNALKLQAHLARKRKDIMFIVNGAGESEAEQSIKESLLMQEIQKTETVKRRLEEEVAKANEPTKDQRKQSPSTTAHATAQNTDHGKENIAPSGREDEADAHTPVLKRKAASLESTGPSPKRRRDTLTLSDFVDDSHAVETSHSASDITKNHAADCVSLLDQPARTVVALTEANAKQGQQGNAESSLPPVTRELRRLRTAIQLSRAKQALQQEPLLDFGHLGTAKCEKLFCDEDCEVPKIGIPISVCFSQDFQTRMVANEDAGTLVPESHNELLRDTGIAQLRGWCQRQGLLANHQAAQDVVQKLKVILDKCEAGLPVLDYGSVIVNKAKTEEANDEAVGKLIGRLEKKFQDLPLVELVRRLKDSLTSRCDAGLEKACESSLTTMQNVYRLGHQQFAATLRRKGTMRDGSNVQLNLLSPLFLEVHGSIAKTLDAGIVTDFASQVCGLVNSFLDSQDVSEKVGNNEKVQALLKECRQGVKTHIDGLIKNTTTEIRQGETIWFRESAFCLDAKLDDAYREAEGKTGKGAFKQQKIIFNRNLTTPAAFNTLRPAADAIKIHIDRTVKNSVVHVIERELAGLLAKIRGYLKDIWKTDSTVKSSVTAARDALSKAQGELKICLQKSGNYSARFKLAGYNLEPQEHD